ncbi:MAG: hypothetical protein A2Y60_03640, partial [Chloroflexi bacterium RBG_13_54_9]
MKCPACKSDMIVVEHSRIELDHCLKCQGVWFDSDELELLLKSSGLESRNLFISNVLASPEAKTAEKKRKCPICGKRMKKTTVGHQLEILIDVCPRGHGLYFDGGELSKLTKQLAEGQMEGSNSQQQLIGFVGEVFKASDK